MPLLVGMLLATSPVVGSAQCYICGSDELCDYQDEGKFGFTECWVGEGPTEGRGECFPGEDAELCEVLQEEQVLAPSEQNAPSTSVLALVARGSMLPADSGYSWPPKVTGV